MSTTDSIPGIVPDSQESLRFRQQMGQVSRQSAVFFAGTIFTAGAAYLFKIYLARTLGARNLGIYALGMTMVGFLGVFNALGLPSAAVRFVAAYNATGKLDLLRGFLVRSSVVLLAGNVVLGVILWLVGPWVAVHFYHAPGLTPYMGKFVFIMLLGVLTAFFGRVLDGNKRVGWHTVIVNFIGSPVVMGLTVALVWLGRGLAGYLWAQIASTVIMLGLMLAAVWKCTPGPARNFLLRPAPLERQVIAFSGTAIGLSLLGFITSQADRVVVGFYLGAKQVGIYAVAVAFVTFVTIILRSVNQIFAPMVSDLHARQQVDLLGRIFQTTTKWIIGFTIPLAAIIIIFSAPLMRIFGRDFEPGWLVLVIGTLGELVNCAVGSSGTLLFMSGQQNTLVKIQGAMAVLMVGLGLALTPRWGIAGAAVSSAVSVSIMNLWYLIEVRRRLGLIPYNRGYWRLALPTVGAVVSGWVLRAKFGAVHSQWLLIGAALALSYIVFIGLAVAIGLDSDDQMIGRAIWSRIRSVIPRTEVRV